jgi:virginiamycin B lyase
LWFSELDGGKLGHLTPTGELTEYELPVPASRPAGIATGAAGALWFAESEDNKIGRVDPNSLTSA